jgi:hypothetical protein
MVSEDSTYQDENGKTITVYASYTVITELHPCWFGNEKNALMPGYYLNLEERVMKDDSLICPWANIGDAETLACIY